MQMVKRFNRKIKSVPDNGKFFDVANPYHNAGKDETSNEPTLRLRVNLTNYVVRIHRQGAINDAQKRVADRICAAYELMGGKGAGGIDYTKTRVDGGFGAIDISDQSLRASETFKDTLRVLGPQGHDLVLNLAGMGKAPRDLVLSRWKQADLAKKFVDCLTTLAIHWGYQQRPWRDSVDAHVAQ
jgi:hypothetical protein